MPHSRSLLRVARRLTADPARAEDLVQETLLLAWRNFRQFQIDTDARAWLFRILFNCFYGQARKERSAPQTVPVSTVETEAWSASTFRSSVSERVDIMRALDALNFEHRTILLLGVVEGFTCQEMAGILSVPVGTVMSRLSRARDALRSRLTGMAKYAGKSAL
jgi:RNA polymerase sigma-70 factor (ECF subfamily)